jgi:hypothetical protein
MFGVFRVKNRDFTPKNHIFFQFQGCPLPPPLPGNLPLTRNKGSESKFIRRVQNFLF